MTKIDDYYPNSDESIFLLPFLSIKSLHIETYSQYKSYWLELYFPNLTELVIDNETLDDSFQIIDIFAIWPKLEIFNGLSFHILRFNSTQLDDYQLPIYSNMKIISMTLDGITLNEFCYVFPNLITAVLDLTEIIESEMDPTNKLIENKLTNLTLIINEQLMNKVDNIWKFNTYLYHFSNLLKLEIKISNNEAIMNGDFIIDPICMQCPQLITFIVPYGSCSIYSLTELLENCNNIKEIYGIFIDKDDFSKFITIIQSNGQNLKKIFFGIEDYDKLLYQNQISENITELLNVFNKFNHSIINIGFNYNYLGFIKTSFGYYSNLKIENYDFKSVY